MLLARGGAAQRPELGDRYAVLWRDTAAGRSA